MPARRAASRSSPTTPSGKTELVAEDVTRQRSRGQRQRAISTSPTRPARRSGSCRRAASRASSTKGSSIRTACMFSPDQTLLYVSDYAAQLSWAFQIQPDGSLAHKQRYFYVHMPDAATRSGADGMTVDTNGSVYIATSLGVQVFDQIGKCHAIIPAPQPRLAVEREVRRRQPRRALRHQRRQGLQAEGEDEGRRVVAPAGQAGAAEAVGTLTGRWTHGRRRPATCPAA